MASRIVIITPPVIKPCEAGVSGAAAASRLRALGVDARWIDANAGWFGHVLSSTNLARCLEGARGQEPGGLLTSYQQALEVSAAHPHPLQRGHTYRSRARYSSAVNHLQNALRLASVPWPGHRARVADMQVAGLRPARSADLVAFASRPGPFDAYFSQVLLPWLREQAPSHVGLSLSFFNQAFAAFRLATLLRERLPRVRLWLGGPLVACWRAVGNDLDVPPFPLFQRVLATPDDDALARLAVELGGHGEAPLGPLAPPLQDLEAHHYLAPEPIVPVALGRGCYWRRCTFCPDHLHPRYQVCQPDSLRAWLHAVARRFPGGAMLHLTDSALPMPLLDHLARVIRQDALPLRWHGFVRLERRFVDPAFAHHLAAGGAAMLQFGLETAAPSLLRGLGKGVTVEQARAVLRSTAAAGIRNHVYLLFGLPGETDALREETLAFVEQEGDAIHDLNNALFNLPRGSPMHRDPARWGISRVIPFGEDTDLSLYDDFRCGDSHPRLEARRWLNRRFFKSPVARRILGQLNNPFKANHSCFLP